jgi:hypothetical protein
MATSGRDFRANSIPVIWNSSGKLDLPVMLVDTAGNPIGSGGAGSGIFAEDAPHTNADKGQHVLGVRNDALAALTSTDLDYGSFNIDSAGRLRSIISGASVAGADAFSNTLAALFDPTGTGRLTGLANHLFNGATWDRQRGNIEGTALASAARTATVNSADITLFNERGIAFYLNVSVASGTGGLQLLIEAKDPVSGSYIALNSLPTAVTATGTKLYQVYPGGSGASITQLSNEGVSRTVRVRMVVGDASSYTYSVGYSTLN